MAAFIRLNYLSKEQAGVLLGQNLHVIALATVGECTHVGPVV